MGLVSTLKTSVAVIILNYRTPQMTVECIETVVPELKAFGSAKAVVVDNASGDGSVEHIQNAIQEHEWESYVHVVPSPVNGGFSAGNNVGIRAIDADYYLLLNSDTLMRPGAIGELVRAIENRADVGLVGPRLEWPDGEPQCSCFRFRTPITEMLAAAGTDPLFRMFPGHVGSFPISDQEMEPDWVSFASCLIRREVVDQVGPLDEGYFMYFDDIDYCRLAQKAGWKVLYRPESRVVHLRGKSGSVKQASAQRKRRPTYYYASRNRYYAKAYGRVGLWGVNLFWTTGRLIALLREVFGSKKPHACANECTDVWINAMNPLRPTVTPHTDS